ncbi:MAG: response regulator transcription factor [Massilimaliae sp.]|nr:response regulator transcription factor [Massiliimalia sp.]
MNIFIVEDDRAIREMERYALQNSGFDVTEFSDAEQFCQVLQVQIPDLILLDIMLPGQDGLTLLEQLRKNPKTERVPVMMVTAKTTEMDKVKGLDTGADDYITKPFGVMELISRVKALLRRSQSALQKRVYEYQGIALDDTGHSVTANGIPCELTFKEYELLKYLISNLHTVLTREQIMSRVWEFEYEGESRTIDMHIKTLRKKLGECGSAIKTVRNVGYKMGE